MSTLQMDTDEYKCLNAPASGIYTEKKSKFLSFAHEVKTIEEAKALVADYQKKFFDARHVCYAYSIGTSCPEVRANDNGEPSGTAGKPILGQILSHELSNTIVIVVRYFGGIKLGTGGLTSAYKAAAAAALDNAHEQSKIEVRQSMQNLTATFEYPILNSVMRVAKDMGADIIEQHFDMQCSITLSIRSIMHDKLHARLSNIEGVTIA